MLANINRDEGKKPDPYRPADFMPGADPHDEWDEFLDAIESGNMPEPDPEEMAVFRRELEATFR